MHLQGAAWRAAASIPTKHRKTYRVSYAYLFFPGINKCHDIVIRHGIHIYDIDHSFVDGLMPNHKIPVTTTRCIRLLLSILAPGPYLWHLDNFLERQMPHYIFLLLFAWLT